MSALESALAEIRTGAADRISVGLSADQCAALAQHIDQLTADLAERGRSLVGQVLAGWPEVLEGANDDLPAVPAPQVEGQTVIALVPGRQDTPAEAPLLAFADEDDAVHHARDGHATCGAPGVRRAECVASVTCRDCLDTFRPAAESGSAR